MNFGEWEARLVDNFDQMMVDLYLMRRTPHGKEVITHDGVLKQIKAGIVRTDGLYFARLEREQVQAIANALSEYGVKTNNDHKSAGLLEATQKHLFDMRAIVYKHEGLMFEADVRERPASPPNNQKRSW